MLTHAQFLARVEAHLEATQTPPSRFGKQAAGDPNFVGDLRGGREPRERTRVRVLAFIEKQARAA